MKLAGRGQRRRVGSIEVSGNDDMKTAKVGKNATLSSSIDRRRGPRARAIGRGEAGSVRIADLTLDEEMVKRARASGAIDAYKQLLQKNSNAQPGRPLVNVKRGGAQGVRYELLSLYELVLASRELGREIVQVLPVRLSDEEARELSEAEVSRPAPVEERLSARDIAAVSGFMELSIRDIVTTENLRKRLDTSSPDFAALVESIRTIGLQNPPVVEVRRGPDGGDLLVCVSGHRRLEALQTLGHERVTCALKLFTSEKHRTLATLAENVNRQDLHFLDKAEGYGLLVEQGMSAQEIATLLDSDPRTVGKYLRAARWDASVKEHVRAIGSKATTRFLLNYLAAGERTTEALHTLIDKFAENAPKKGSPRRSREREIEAKLGEFFELSEHTPRDRALVEQALRFLGVIR